MKKHKEKIMEIVFLLTALVSILAVALICIFLFANGLPAMKKIGFTQFLLGKTWKPGNGIYGIFPMIIGSLYVTAGAIIIGVPIGILSAVFLARFCPKKLYRFLKPAVDLLAGIPSVVYGFFGLVVMVPFVREQFGGDGLSVFTASVLLGIMILPTIIRMTEVSLRAVPHEYKEGALALGASKLQYIFKVQLGAAKSGIMAGIVLGIGRALGETMAVILVSGNAAIIPKNLVDPVRTLTANIAIEMSYATGVAQQALFATGMVLFALIMLVNFALNKFISSSERRSGNASKA